MVIRFCNQFRLLSARNDSTTVASCTTCQNTTIDATENDVSSVEPSNVTTRLATTSISSAAEITQIPGTATSEEADTRGMIINI